MKVKNHTKKHYKPKQINITKLKSYLDNKPKTTNARKQGQDLEDEDRRGAVEGRS